MGASPNQQSQGAWRTNLQKHAEHLRLVHFTWLVTMTGLLIVTSVNPSGPAASAYQDLNQISQVVEDLESDWLIRLVETTIETARERGDDRLEAAAYNVPVRIAADDTSPALSLALPLYFDPFVFPPPPKDTFVPQDPLLTPFEAFEPQEGPSGLESVTLTQFRLPGQSTRLSRLSDFKRLWDLLYVTRSVDLISSVAPQILVLSHGLSEGDEQREIDIDPRLAESLDEWLDAMENADASPGALWLKRNDDTRQRWQRLLSLDLEEPINAGTDDFLIVKDWNALTTLSPLPKDIEFNRYVRTLVYHCVDIDDQICAVVFIPIDVVGLRIEGHEHLISRAREIADEVLWRETPFADSFPELNALTINIADVPMPSLLRHLRQERQRTGEQFGAFGLSVPSSAIAVWGPLIAILLSLYFYLHTERFVRTADRYPEVFTFPWIGFYRAPVARVVFWFSVVVYPLGVVVYMAGIQPIWRLPIALAAIWQVLAVVALMVIGARHKAVVSSLFAVTDRAWASLESDAGPDPSAEDSPQEPPTASNRVLPGSISDRDSTGKPPHT